MKFFRKHYVLICLMVIFIVAIGGLTYAFLYERTSYTNGIFYSGELNCSVIEEMNENNTAKTSICVKNEGTVPAYARIKIVTYWIDSENKIIGKTSGSPSLIISNNWLRSENNIFYYKTPIVPNGTSTNLIASEIILETDSEGNKQVVEIIPEIIQSIPEKAVENSWNVVLENSIITSCE